VTGQLRASVVGVPNGGSILTLGPAPALSRDGDDYIRMGDERP